jgi:hypothetical protein
MDEDPPNGTLRFRAVEALRDSMGALPEAETPPPPLLAPDPKPEFWNPPDDCPRLEDAESCEANHLRGCQWVPLREACMSMSGAAALGFLYDGKQAEEELAIAFGSGSGSGSSSGSSSASRRRRKSRAGLAANAAFAYIVQTIGGAFRSLLEPYSSRLGKVDGPSVAASLVVTIAYSVNQSARGRAVWEASLDTPAAVRTAYAALQAPWKIADGSWLPGANPDFLERVRVFFGELTSTEFLDQLLSLGAAFVVSQSVRALVRFLMKRLFVGIRDLLQTIFTDKDVVGFWSWILAAVGTVALAAWVALVAGMFSSLWTVLSEIGSILSVEVVALQKEQSRTGLELFLAGLQAMVAVGSGTSNPLALVMSVGRFVYAVVRMFVGLLFGPD